ncbi:MAG: tRNA preQ1(34) S-adenosylmethionine ribosyltransferase-isomerase QueA [Phycisphaerales bacterium]|nr:tRNA preQ1(34) S-adenosylmethionine ribosyltransferase-isomerase QueA [Phycisphaerales bacterium]
MKVSELAYDLPPELIAQHPAPQRDASRLLVLHRDTGRIEHRTFRDLSAYLRPGDCLVLNDTRVLPARFFAERSTGGRVEALFLSEEGGDWHVLLKPAGRQRPGEWLGCPGDPVRLQLVERGPRGAWRVRPEPPTPAAAFLARVGHPPLPPYIRRTSDPAPGSDALDAERYQTVYAAHGGAIAAPTAGLHFTQSLLDQLAAGGVRRATLTLHVGIGTFTPVEVEDLADHRMHPEWYAVPADSLRALDQARRDRGRVVAVGTTAVRVLETLGRLGQVLGAGGVGDSAAAVSGWTEIFIYPPYRFVNVDALVTNFHLPGSTLLALVMALAGRDLILSAYEAAIAERYRFYSYGDAMLIL